MARLPPTDFVLIPRNVAAERGLKFFQSMLPCDKGHNAPRYVKGGNCAICRASYSRHQYESSRDKVLNRQRERYAADPKAKLARNRAWAEVNRKSRRASSKRLREARPELFATHAARRRAAKLQRSVAWFGEFDEFVTLEAAALAARRRALTGLDWAVDHMLPLRGREVSGLHCAQNLQVIPRALNGRKRNTLWLTEPFEWVRYV